MFIYSLFRTASNISWNPQLLIDSPAPPPWKLIAVQVNATEIQQNNTIYWATK
jgi:hypothetical protein